MGTGWILVGNIFTIAVAVGLITAAIIMLRKSRKEN